MLNASFQVPTLLLIILELLRYRIQFREKFSSLKQALKKSFNTF